MLHTSEIARKTDITGPTRQGEETNRLKGFRIKRIYGINKHLKNKFTSNGVSRISPFNANPNTI